MPLTPEQIVDAEQDLATIADVANGAADINGTGLVTNRLGQTVKTLQKVIADLYGTDIGGILAASLDARIDVLEYGDGLSISSFTVTPAVIEVGGSANVAIAGAISGTTTSRSVTDSVSGSVTLTGPSTGFTGSVASVNSARTLTLTASNTGAPGGTDTKTATRSVVFQHKSHFGWIDKTTGISSGEVNGMSESWFEDQTDRTIPFTTGADAYLWFSQLASLPDPVFKLDGGVIGPVRTTRSHINASGHTDTFADFLLSARVTSGTSGTLEIIR